MSQQKSYLARVLDSQSGAEYAFGFYADSKQLAREHANYATADAMPSCKVRKVVQAPIEKSSAGLFVLISK